MPTYPDVGPYRVLNSRDIYRNRWLSVREDSVIRPGGTEGLFGVVRMKPGSSVLAMTEHQEVFLVREFKYGVARETLELISGALEHGECPLDAAKRELREEVGLAAAEWVDLGDVDPFTTVIQSPNYMFLALGLSELGQLLDEGEILQPVRVPFHRLVEMVRNSEVTHAASCVAVLKTLEYLRSR
jgi:ADP-ribose pyrophosphatase